MASLFPFLSIAALFHGCWHPRYRHERLRYLIEQLPRILFFAQRRCEKLNNLGLTHLHGQVSGPRVSRHFIVLDPLSCPDQGEVGESIVLGRTGSSPQAKAFVASRAIWARCVLQ